MNHLGLGCIHGTRINLVLLSNFPGYGKVIYTLGGTFGIIRYV